MPDGVMIPMDTFLCIHSYQFRVVFNGVLTDSALLLDRIAPLSDGIADAVRVLVASEDAERKVP